MLWSLWAQLVVFAMSVLAAGVESITVDLNPATSGLVVWQVLDGVSVLVSLVVIAMSLGGWWLLSAENPGWAQASAEIRRPTLRLSIRMLWIVLAASAVLDALVTISATFFSIDPMLIGVFGFLMLFVYAAVGSVQMAWVRCLSQRVPDMRLAGFAGTMVWLHPLLATVGCLLIGLGPLAAWIIAIVIGTKLLGRLRQIQAQAARLADAA